MRRAVAAGVKHLVQELPAGRRNSGTTYTKPDGQAGGGRYTDVCARRDGRWLAVSAHVTRC